MNVITLWRKNEFNFFEEATDNAKDLISDKEIYWSLLTEEGKKTVQESIELLPKDISTMYVSPLPRTIETAHYVFLKYPNIDVHMEERIREISYGKYSHCKNNSELDETRIKQINGDYLVRFGDYGENKLEIENRLSSFLLDLYNSDIKGNVLIVSHGSVISYMKRLLDLKSSHIKKGTIEIFNDISFDHLLEYRIKLDNIK